MTINCTHCGKENPPSNARGVKERRYCSKQCSHAAWILAHPERRAAHQRKYDKGERGANMIAAWRSKNVERLKALGRASYERNRDAFIARADAWAEANPDKVKASKRTYAATDRGKQKAHESRWSRIAREHGAIGSFAKAEFLALCEKTDGRCVCCLKIPSVLEADHVIALVAGGRNDISNIQPLCRKCNAEKGSASRDYRQEFALQPMDLLFDGVAA